jgi:hypothetical protein
MGFPDDLKRLRESVFKSSPDGKLRQTKCVLDFSPNDSSQKPSENYIPIDTETSSSTFDWKTFSSELKTSKLGRVVIHTETARSTTDFLDGPNFMHDGLAVIADRQTQGRGRAGNVWLSPEGNRHSAKMEFSSYCNYKSSNELKFSVAKAEKHYNG